MNHFTTHLRSETSWGFPCALDTKSLTASLPFWILLIAVFLATPVCFAAETALVESASENQESPDFRSVFVSDPSVGKDPFFPNSKRRIARPIQPVEPQNQPEKNPVEVVFEGLELKGISLGANKKLAIINNYTFAEGEKRNVKVGNQVAEVRCIDIQERSVWVTVNDRIRKELHLRDGL